MKVILSGKIINVFAKSYEFQGVKGITHKLALYNEEENHLYNVTIKKEQFEQFKELIGQAVDLECNLYIKGSYNLRVVE